MSSLVRRRSLAYWLAYAAIGGLAFWVNEGNADEGLTLVGAWRVSLGEVPYRDFFDFVTPGSFYLFGALFKLFGPTYLVARAAAVVLLLASGWALTKLARPLLTGWRLAALPFLWLALFSYYPLINHNPLSLFAAVWAWLALEHAARRRTPAAYLLAGLAAGVVTWLLQTKGLAVLAAATVVILSSYRAPKRLPFYLAGWAAALLPLLAWPLPLLGEALVAFPLQYYVPVNATSMLPWWFGIGVQGVAGFAVWRRRSPPAVVGLWWLGLFLLVSTATRTDPRHVVLGVVATVPLLLWLLPPRAVKARAPWPGAALVAAAVLVAVAAGGVATAAARLVVPRTARQWLSLEHPLHEAIVRRIQAVVPPDASLYSGPFLPNFYFEAGRRNQTRFNVLITGHHPAAWFAEAARQLEANPPPLAVVNYRVVEQFGYNRDNPLDRFLAERYRPVARVGHTVLLQRQ